MTLLADPLLWVALVFLLFTVGLGVMLHSMVYGRRARLHRRIATVSAMSVGRGGVLNRDTADDLQSRRKMVSGKLKELDAARKRKGRRASLQQAIVRAGLSLSMTRFFVLSAAAAGAVALLSLLLGLPLIAVLGFAVTAGVGLPRWILGLMGKRRIAKFTAGFPDAIDVIVRGIRSGLPISETFNIIVTETPDPVGTEFRIVVESQRLGLTLDDALARACERVPTAELRFFAIVLGIQQTTGGNLAETLAKLSEVIRSRKRMRDKAQAMAGEAKASAIIIGSLPPLVAVLLAVVSPQYIGTLFTNPLGHLILLAGAVMTGIGILVMRRMINFDI
jgi:tight adherence protein B